LINGCFQEVIPQISHGELTDLEVIGEGGFGVAYRAKHAQFGTIVYKELNAQKLGDRYSTDCTILVRLNFDAVEISTNSLTVM